MNSDALELMRLISIELLRFNISSTKFNLCHIKVYSSIYSGPIGGHFNQPISLLLAVPYHHYELQKPTMKPKPLCFVFLFFVTITGLAFCHVGRGPLGWGAIQQPPLPPWFLASGASGSFESLMAFF